MENRTTLTLQDMMLVVSIIDTVSERGAFKGNELSSVGELRNKFAAFVQENMPEEDKQNAAKNIADEAPEPESMEVVQADDKE